MMEGQTGDSHAYEKPLRELDVRCCYVRRLPFPAAEDARQDGLFSEGPSYGQTEPDIKLSRHASDLKKDIEE